LVRRASNVGARTDHAAEVAPTTNQSPSRQAPLTTLTACDDRFEVFRADEVQVTSTRFAGGDWRWRLADAADNTLAKGSGYTSRQACEAAVSNLRDRAGSAS
jgi:uncharacterized protein YegP (UPF0339 family)